jgi:hypothetical protein
VGHCTYTNGGVDKFQVLIVIQGHGGNPVARLARFAGLYAQSFEGVSEFTGALVPLTPGESVVLAGVSPIDDADVIGIEVEWPLHEVGEE